MQLLDKIHSVFTAALIRQAQTASIFFLFFFFPFILDIKFVGRTSRGHTGGRSHMISHPPSFCGACLNFSREKYSAIPFPRRPRSRVLCTKAVSYEEFFPRNFGVGGVKIFPLKISSGAQSEDLGPSLTIQEFFSRKCSWFYMQRIS